MRTADAVKSRLQFEREVAETDEQTEKAAVSELQFVLRNDERTISDRLQELRAHTGPDGPVRERPRQGVRIEILEWALGEI